MSPHAPPLRGSLPPTGADSAWGGPAPNRMNATVTAATPLSSVRDGWLADAWRRLDTRFAQVDAVFDDLMAEARALLPEADLPAYLEAARVLGKLGRGVEPMLVFLEEWPSAAQALGGPDALHEVMAFVMRLQKSPNGKAIAPFLQTLAPVARRLEADLGLISQVFANLLANAVKYTTAMPANEAREEKLVLYGWNTLPHAFGTGQPGIRLFVSTTGHEIPRQEWSRLFDADFRSSDAKSVEGSGHGLYFVKQIVELHKGRVGYSYEKPMNTFAVTLPRQVGTKAAPESGSCPIPS